MTGTDNSPKAAFNIVEASIADHRKALDSGEVTSVDLVVSYLNRIARYDTCEGLNAFTVFNENVLEEAAASDARRAQGLKPRPLEGIPYTIKDSYKVAGMTATAGSPALEGVMSNEDSAIAKKLRDAGAILMGKTNMPPMAAGGMQRGLYGRAESPYNSKYLTAAFSSGSSNGAGTSIAASMAVFGMGSETVSSGRSPASNNALVCYTPSKGLLSCRGLWPLYVTCDVPTPYTRTVDDMLEVLNIIATPDEETAGDFVREQKHVAIPPPPQIDYTTLRDMNAFNGKRIGVPKMYIGQKDSDPHAKPTYVSPEVIALWETTAKDLEKLGAEIIYTDFPLVTNYENDSVSGEANNVAGQPADWNHLERGLLIAQAWDGFLRQNNDPKIKCLADIKDPAMLFPKPKDYVPDTFLEVRNWINYAGLPKLVQPDKSIHDVPGLKQALLALEAQRKRDLEDWMDSHKLDLIAFPAQGDVGLADLEFNLDSATHSLRNGVKYSNGNRAIRHLGVPTVSVPMGVMPDPKNMPVNITFAGRAYKDTELLAYAYAFEAATKKRVSPSRTPKLDTDDVVWRAAVVQVSSESDSALLGSASEPKSKSTHERLIRDIEVKITDRPMPHVVSISIKPTLDLSSSSSSTTDEKKKHARLQIFIQGKKVTDTEWTSNELSIACPTELVREVALGWDLKPLKYRDVMIVVVATDEGLGRREAKLVWGRLGEVAPAS